ncbi:MAG: NTP transferase domain-containing protein [Bdellovibrionaceae bacterium]|nr:NTP transferase domain-containing protein [Pseudobdellovibrionaceae bacterium]
MAVKAFVLAAGLGTRLRPYTHKLPKPIIPFMGIPMIGYALHLINNAGIGDVVINTHPFSEKVRNCVGDLNNNRFHITFSNEEREPLGSGGALYKARNELQTSPHFFAINGDTVFIPKQSHLLNELLEQHQRSHSLCTLVVSEDPALIAQFNPLWVDKNNRLVSVGKQPSTPGCRPVHYLGVKVFHQRVFQFVPSGITNIFSDVLLPALKIGETVTVMSAQGLWWETGNFDSFFKATQEAMQLIQSKKDNSYFSDMYKWVDKDFDFSISQNSNDTIFLHKKSAIPIKNISGSAFIDADTTCSPDVLLKDVIVNQGCRLDVSSTSAMHFKEFQ